MIKKLHFLLVLWALLLVHCHVQGQNIRFQDDIRGGFAIAGNSLLNNSTLSFLNTAGGNTKSSSSDLVLPANSTIIKAYLYVEGYTGTKMTSVRFRVPGGSYITYTTASAGFMGNPGSTYQQFMVDVTSAVSPTGYISTVVAGGDPSGNGRYAVADPTPTGSNNGYGWSLIVVYTNPASKYRSVTIADNNSTFGFLLPPVTITINNVSVPSSGTVNAVVGITGSYGDEGLTDGASFGPVPGTATALSDPFTGVTNDILNSSVAFAANNNVSADGGPAMSGNFTGRNPYLFVCPNAASNPNWSSYFFDADILNASGTLPNSTTPINVRLSQTSGGADALGSGSYAIAIDIAAAVLTKSVSPAAIASGGVATYTFTIANTQPGAINLTNIGFVDNLPSGLMIATPANATVTGGTGGTVTATAGGSSISLSGLSLASGQTATVTVSVTNVPGQTNPSCASNPAAFTNGFFNIASTTPNLANGVTDQCLVVTLQAPPPPVTDTVVYCQGATAVPLTATGSNLLWYTTPTGGTGSATAPTPSTATPGTTTWYVSQTQNGVESPRSPSVVIVNATPAAPTVSSPVTYCQNATAAPLTATGSNLRWYTQPTGGTGSVTAPTPSTATPGTTTWYVSQTVNGCEGPRAPISVTINATPSAPTVTSPVTYCQNATATPLTATGSNLLWYTQPTGGTGSATAPTPSTATPGTTTWYVSQTINGCEGPRASINVTINATPAAPTVNSPVTYCQNATAAPLTATGSNLLWYTQPTGGTGSATAPTPSTTTPGTTTWYVSQTINGCEGPRASLSVTIKPNVTNTATAQICPGGSYQFGSQTLTAAGTYTATFNAANGCDSTVTLTLSVGSVIVTNTNATICQGQSYTFNGSTYTTTGSHSDTFASAGGCDSVTTLNLTVNALPSAPTVTSQVTYCQNATATPLTATGSNLLWYTQPTGGTGSVTAPTPSTTTPGTTTWYVSQTVNGCEGPRASISVTVNATPAAPTVNSPVTYCQNATAAPLTATGSNLLWYTQPTGGTGTATAPTPSTATPGTTTWYVSQTINGCESPRASISVTVNATPAAPTVSSPVTYCQNATAAPLTATGSNLLWYTTPTGGTGSATTPTPSTATPGTTTWYVSQTVNGCESPRASISVTINATPAAPTVSSPVTYCQNATAAPLTATGSNLLWYTTPTGGTGSATAPTPSTTTPGTTTWYVSQTINGCESPRASISVTINATPAAPTVTSPVTYCQNATAAPLTATGSNLLWYTQPTGGTGSATAPTPSTTTPGTTTWYVSQTINGCEGPRASLSVTIKPNVTHTATAQICPGGSYQFGSQTLTAAGTYTATFNAANGCDSTVTLTLSVGSVITTNTNATICQGQSYTFNGSTYTTTGSHSDTFASASGCDSVTTLNLTVNALPSAPTVTSPVTYCQNATATPLTATGSNLLWYTTPTGGTGSATAPTPSTTTPGTTTWYVSQTVNGCEGPRASLSVTVLLNVTHTATAQICPGGSYQFGSQTLTAAGTYTETFDAANGCDSTVTLTLSVGSVITTNTNATICQGQSYTFNGSTYTTTGSHSDTFASVSGCDSVTTLNLTVNALPSAPTVTSPVTYCQNATATPLTATGSNLLWYTQPTGGTGSVTAPTPSTTTPGTTTWYVSQTVNGCEGPRASISVTVNAPPAAPTVTSPVTYCQNATATPLTATGSNLLWYTQPTGGTGTATAPTPSTTTPGTTTWYVSQTVNGCEGSRASLSVTIKPNVTHTTTAQICPGGSYQFGSQTLTAAGTYTETFNAANGCDSTVTLTLSISNLILFNTNATICQGQSYTFNGNAYTVSGSYSDTFATNSCDSVSTLNLTVTPLPSAPTVTSPVTYCQNATASPLTATGSNLLWYTQPAGGTGSATVPTPSTATPGTTTWYVSQTVNGCEGPRASISVTINATPSAPTVTSPVTYCQNATATPLTATGSSLLWYTQPTGGTGTATAPTPSTVTPGTMTWYVSQTVSGCEGPRASISVIVNPSPVAPTVTSPVTYCQNATASPLTATGSNLLWYTQPTGGTGTATAPTPSTTTPGTTSWYVSQTVNGCEGPRAQVAVTIYPTPAVPGVAPVTYCQDATATPLTATGSNLLWYTQPTGGTGSATAPTPSTTTPGTTTWYVSQTVNGCEGPRASISVTINATPSAPAVASPVTYCQNATASPLTATGSSLLWYTQPTGGTGTATAPTPSTATPGTTSWYVSQTVNGCEGPRASISVTINATPAAPAATSPVTYCQDATASPLTATGSNLLWYTQSTGGTGTATAPTPSTTTPGTTTWYVSQTINGCEGARTAVSVVVYPTPAAPGVEPIHYCQGDEATPLSAQGSGLHWYTSATGGNGSATAPVPSTADIDTLTWYVSQVINGCEGPRVPVTVFVHPYPTVDPKIEIVGSVMYLNANAGGADLSYGWTPPEGLSCTDCPRPEADPSVSTVYTIKVTTAAGCTVSDTIGVYLTCARVFFPNTFTPNGDGNNDRFYPMGHSIELVKTFRIYNRWGELVYSRDNIPANDPLYGWDGTYQSKTLKPDAFVYYVEAICKTGESIFLKGDITLMR